MTARVDGACWRAAWRRSRPRPLAARRRRHAVQPRFPDLGPLRRLPQRPADAVGRGHLDRLRLAREHDGELVARSVLAGERAPRDRSIIPSRRRTIEDECSICHMPITRYEAKLRGEQGRGVRAPAVRLPTRRRPRGCGRRVVLGVPPDRHGRSSARARASTAASSSTPPDARTTRPEYGPFEIDTGHTRIMRTLVEGYRPTQADHIRQSELCATCHTLLTKALGPGGKVDRRAAGAGAVPGVAAQRLQGHAELPVVPHAGGEGAGADHARVRRAARGRVAAHVRRRPTSSCSGC